MQHRCKKVDGLVREEEKKEGERGRNSRNAKEERKKRRIEGNNPHEFCSTSAGVKKGEKEKKNPGEIASKRRKLQTRKLSSSYYLRRDHGPASRELSGIPRSLNTLPSTSYRLGRELFDKVEKGTAHETDVRLNIAND